MSRHAEKEKGGESEDSSDHQKASIAGGLAKGRGRCPIQPMTCFAAKFAG
jgi:hypothetical protein